MRRYAGNVGHLKLPWLLRNPRPVCCLPKYARPRDSYRAERIKSAKAIGSSLQKMTLKILQIVNRDKDHIPPITTSEANPFPYTVELNPRVEGWGSRGIGIF